MVLTDLWHTARHHLQDKQIAQIIKFAGKGKLLDGSPASLEFRHYLSHISSAMLHQYAQQCLASNFSDAGLALQDIVNQTGARLGLTVDYGAYRSGADGVWHLPDGRSIVLEVKTSDTYRFDMTTLTGYREKLTAAGIVDPEKTSILIVVGREDTGGIEAQIRGSRFAWDIRLISVEGIMQLLNLREANLSQDVDALLHDVLTPKEYIRLDNLIRLMFQTNPQHQESKAEPDVPRNSTEAEVYWKASTPGSKARPVSFYSAVKENVEDYLRVFLLRRNRSAYSSPDEISTAVVIIVSRLHPQSGYWFALHPHQLDFLADAEEGYFALGCGSPDNVLLLPLYEVQTWLEMLSETQRNGQPIWHLNVILAEDQSLTLMTRREFDNIPLNIYALLTH